MQFMVRYSPCWINKFDREEPFVVCWDQFGEKEKKMDWVWWIENCAIIGLCVILGKFICDTVSRIKKRSDDQLKINRKFVNASTQTDIGDKVVGSSIERIQENLTKKIQPKVSQKIKMPNNNTEAQITEKEPKIATKKPDLNANFTEEGQDAEEKPSVKNLRMIFEASGREASPNKSHAMIRRNKLSAEVRMRKPINMFNDPVTISLVNKYMKPQPAPNAVVRRRRVPSNSNDRVTSVDEILKQQRLSRSLSEYSVSEYVDESENTSAESEFRKLIDSSTPDRARHRRSTPSFTGSFTEEFEDELLRLPGSRNSLIFRQSLTKCVSTENISENGHSFITHYQSCFDLTRNPRDTIPNLNRQESRSVSNLQSTTFEEIYFENTISNHLSQYSFPEI